MLSSVLIVILSVVGGLVVVAGIVGFVVWSIVSHYRGVEKNLQEQLAAWGLVLVRHEMGHFGGNPFTQTFFTFRVIRRLMARDAAGRILTGWTSCERPNLSRDRRIEIRWDGM